MTRPSADRSGSGRPVARIAARGRAELEIRRSRFIATVAPAATEDEARAVLAGVRAEFRDARHHCLAWHLGIDVPRAHTSDDGEPAGTGGVPMLGVLLDAGLTDTVAVVTRYFGGILLGAGGLTRAYAAAVRAAVEVAGSTPVRQLVPATIDAGPAAAGRLEHVLRAAGWEPATTWTGHGARLVVEVPPGDADELTRRVAEATAGSASVSLGDPHWA